MQAHYWEGAVDYDVTVSQGFVALKPSAYTARDADLLDYRTAPADKSNMDKYLFGGFQRCLYPSQKFQANAERMLAVILEREAIKWFKPARGQFHIYYRQGTDHREYQPDFVAETADTIYMLEPKRNKELNDPEVLAKRDAAVTWCQRASDHARDHGLKSWKYVLIPHDAITDNMTLLWLAQRYGS
jgi:type III restriction enzyme